MGPLSYKVSIDDELIWYCHIDQLHRSVLPEAEDLSSDTAALEFEPNPLAEWGGPSDCQS